MSISPSKQHRYELIYIDEIRFGPPYYSLKINGKLLRNRIFGEVAKWSNDSRYLAVQEWLTIDYAEGPITRVMLFDMEANKYTTFKELEKGFVEKFRFINDQLIYLCDYNNRKRTNEEVRIELGSIKKWYSMKLCMVASLNYRLWRIASSLLRNSRSG
ncbi:hypothetical protein [Leptospira sarikeiensis]|uniref:Uncharacterized protein n=1 Tax=Leptospira sarikeiensis TaxID=2484943 RepID=A0A4R9K8M7_9LEPT|nr:hypothetical protein [Leptospira sarikeiensis]TGL62022.1 hypothetical protein EHQ64_09140 [Leptospira sarikeiensis]